MLYDGDCRFCVRWIRRWMRITGDAVEYAPLQDDSTARLYPEVGRERLEEAVHLIGADGTICQGAEAAFRALATHPSWRWALRWYLQFPRFARFAEWCYQLVAEHRRAGCSGPTTPGQLELRRPRAGSLPNGGSARRAP